MSITLANYRGFARHDYLYLTGRVLKDKSISRTEQDGLWRNLINNFKRFNSREIPAAQLRVEWGSKHFDLITDAEGYFKIEETFKENIWTSAGLPLLPSEDGLIELASGPTATRKPALWQKAKITVKSTPKLGPVNFESFSDVLLPDPQQAEYGIISDIDDTVLQTDVTSLLKLRAMLHTVLKNAGDRHAFEEVANFYQALQLGPDGEGHNPCFYVSNSPWNLYDMLQEFLELNKLPRGPILLRDFGLPYEDKPEDYLGHKAEMVGRILRTYADLPFVLIGDSGEHDFNIYLEAAKAYPGQIKQIYIRDVQHKRRARRIQQLIDMEADIPARLVSTYTEALEHAKSTQLI